MARKSSSASIFSKYGKHLIEGKYQIRFTVMSLKNQAIRKYVYTAGCAAANENHELHYYGDITEVTWKARDAKFFEARPKPLAPAGAGAAALEVNPPMSFMGFSGAASSGR